MKKRPIAHAELSNNKRTIIEHSDQMGYVKLDRFGEKERITIKHPKFEDYIVAKKDLKRDPAIYMSRKRESEQIEPVVIISKSGDKSPEMFSHTARINRKEIVLLAPQTSADMLENSGQVFVQKSQQGGGSPILRGFEASRVLLVVDGVRMNNAIYRSGHLQNSITIDNAILQSTDVIFGPFSYLYGSDAIGGVVHFKTKDPILAKKGNKYYSAGAYTRANSANNGYAVHANFNLGHKKSGFFGALTYNRFGDLRMGANRFHGDEEFGKIPFYVQRINGVDSMVASPDPNVHHNSGYEQLDGILKYVYKFNPRIQLKLNTQFSTSSYIPRFDKLNEYEEDDDQQLKWAEWNYGPQQRVLNSIQLTTKKQSILFDQSSTIIAHQNVRESRISRRFGNEMREHQEENVHVLSFNTDFIKTFYSKNPLRFNYGIEWTHNDVKSNAWAKNIEEENEANVAIPTRYPGNGSNLTTASSYFGIQRKWEDKHILKGGVRFGTQRIRANFIENQIVDELDLKVVELSNNFLTGSVGYIRHFGKHLKFTSGISRGYKAPNIDDFGKIFEKKGELTVPNEDLRQETVWNLENGISFKSKRLSLYITIFNTQVQDLIAKDTFSIANENEIVLDGDDDTLQLVTNKNIGTAVINGFTIGGKVKFSKHLSFFATGTLIRGDFIESNVDGQVPHIPPFYGRAALMYEGRRTTSTFYTKFNGRKFWDDYAPSTDNQSESIEDFGSPAWMTLNFSIKSRIYKKISAQFAVENILDAHYKTFASGVSAPGRNFIATLYYNL